MTYKFIEKIVDKGLWHLNFNCYHANLRNLEGKACKKLWLIDLDNTYCLLCDYHYNSMLYSKPQPKKYEITDKDIFALKLLL